MFTQQTRALARPQHLFDLPAFAVWSLAAIGRAALAGAHALDSAIARQKAAAPHRQRRTAHPPSHDEYLVPDSWRIR